MNDIDYAYAKSRYSHDEAHGIFIFSDMMNYTVNIHNEGDVLEIVTNAGESIC